MSELFLRRNNGAKSITVNWTDGLGTWMLRDKDVNPQWRASVSLWDQCLTIYEATSVGLGAGVPCDRCLGG